MELNYLGWDLLSTGDGRRSDFGHKVFAEKRQSGGDSAASDRWFRRESRQCSGTIPFDRQRGAASSLVVDEVIGSSMDTIQNTLNEDSLKRSKGKGAPVLAPAQQLPASFMCSGDDDGTRYPHTIAHECLRALGFSHIGGIGLMSRGANENWNFSADEISRARADRVTAMLKIQVAARSL